MSEIDERRVRQIIREELRALFGRVFGDERTFSTRKGESPPGYSRDAWRDLARRIGVKRGRWYYVSAEALDAYERGDRDVKPSNDSAPASGWSPADAARALGLRAVGGGR